VATGPPSDQNLLAVRVDRGRVRVVNSKARHASSILFVFADRVTEVAKTVFRKPRVKCQAVRPVAASDKPFQIEEQFFLPFAILKNGRQKRIDLASQLRHEETVRPGRIG